MKDNITLIGLPAAGKSTIGVLLAKRVEYDFLDVDILIQQRTGKRLEEIIEAEGTEGFLKIEEEVNASLDVHRTVIAPGGSVIYGQRAMEHLSQISQVVYLKVSFADWGTRLGDLKQRGVVVAEGMTLRDLYDERCKRYDAFAASHDCIVALQKGNDFEEIITQTIRVITERIEFDR